MAEDTSTEPQAEDAETEGRASRKGKPTSPLGRRATRSLRRARAVFEGNEWQDSNEAEFLIQEATVLALMDLAEAVREQNRDRD